MRLRKWRAEEKSERKKRLSVPARAAGFERPLSCLLAARSPQLVAAARSSRYNDGVAFRIREFEKTDFETLWRIDQSCFDRQLAYSRPELAFYMRRPGSFALVAEGEGVRDSGGGPASILGFIVAEGRRKSGHIITIDVIAAARRAGVGSALLRAAEERLLRAGALAVTLETPVNNEAAIRFYKRKGYFVEKTVAGYYSGELDALAMAKELAQPPVG
jgi:[ribosomal protein S18]-alanine N-acetyltransferase